MRLQGSVTLAQRPAASTESNAGLFVEDGRALTEILTEGRAEARTVGQAQGQGGAEAPREAAEKQRGEGGLGPEHALHCKQSTNVQPRALQELRFEWAGPSERERVAAVPILAWGEIWAMCGAMSQGPSGVKGRGGGRRAESGAASRSQSAPQLHVLGCILFPTQIVHQVQSELSGNSPHQGVGHRVQTRIPHAACHCVPVSPGGPTLPTASVIYSLHVHSCGAMPCGSE